MKKRILLVLLLSVLIISLISLGSAIEIKTQKNDFSKLETFQATITGNILENIDKEDVGFYRDHVQIPLTYDVIKFNNTYYIFAILPITERNYSVKISQLNYRENNQVKTEDVEKVFNVINETAPFNFFPGFVITNQDFKIKLSNNLDSPTTISYTFENTSSSINLDASENKDLTISIKNIKQTSVKTLTLSQGDYNYDIFTYIIPNESDTTEPIDTSKPRIILEFYQDPILLSMKKGSSFTDTLTLAYLGQNDSGDITLRASDEIKKYISFSKTRFSDLESGDIIEVNFTVTASNIEDQEGYIEAISDDLSDRIRVKLNFGSNITTQIGNYSINNSNTQIKMCSQKGGDLCSSNNYCDGITTSSSDSSSTEFCCVGQCKTYSEPSSSVSRNWVALFVIIIILVILGLFFWMKYKKGPKAMDGDVFDKKIKNFDDRMESRGKLTKF